MFSFHYFRHPASKNQHFMFACIQLRLRNMLQYLRNYTFCFLFQAKNINEGEQKVLGSLSRKYKGNEYFHKFNSLYQQYIKHIKN